MAAHRRCRSLLQTPDRLDLASATNTISSSIHFFVFTNIDIIMLREEEKALNRVRQRRHQTAAVVATTYLYRYNISMIDQLQNRIMVPASSRSISD